MAHTFYTGSGVDYYEVIEFLLRRYGSLEEIKKMPFVDFCNFYKVAKDRSAREELYSAWVSCLPHMSKDSFVPFEQYYEKCTGQNMDNRPSEEILAEVEEIRRKVKENGNINI